METRAKGFSDVLAVNDVQSRFLELLDNLFSSLILFGGKDGLP